MKKGFSILFFWFLFFGFTFPVSAEKLTVLTSNSSAKIFLNDEYIGTEKILNFEIQPGTYFIKVFKDANMIYSKSIEIEKDKNKTLSIDPSNTQKSLAEMHVQAVFQYYQDLREPVSTSLYFFGAGFVALGLGAIDWIYPNGPHASPEVRNGLLLTGGVFGVLGVYSQFIWKYPQEQEYINFKNQYQYSDPDTQKIAAEMTLKRMNDTARTVRCTGAAITGFIGISEFFAYSYYLTDEEASIRNSHYFSAFCTLASAALIYFTVSREESEYQSFLEEKALEKTPQEKKTTLLTQPYVDPYHQQLGVSFSYRF